jgi:choice-of-anchor C domain-containing protein
MRLALFSLSIVLAYVLHPWPAQPLPIVNGSFEISVPLPSVGGFLNHGAGSTGILGWEVTSGDVDVVGFFYYPSSDRLYSIDLNGQQRGAIAQTFDTTPSVPMTVYFDLGANPRNPGPDIEYSRIEVSAAGQSEEFEIYIGGDESSPHWTTMSFTFTPTASTTTIEFQSLSGGEAGPTLDHVNTTGEPGRPAPEPTTALLLAGGLLGLLAAARRRSFR